MSRLARRDRVDHPQTAARLRRNPGVWQTVGDYRSSLGADSTAGLIRTASARSISGAVYQPAGSFEARTELTDDGVRVLARYIGRRSKPTLPASYDADRVLGQIDRGEIWCGPDAAREIAARAEDAYGAAFTRAATSTTQTDDATWADAAAALHTTSTTGDPA